MDQRNEEKTIRVDDRFTPDTVDIPASPCTVNFSGTPTGKVYWLSSDEALTIGRAPENDVCIRDQPVSQRHARVVVSPEGTVFIEDLGSTNGTYVNGERVMQHALRDGDKVLIPPHYILKFCYQVNAAPEAAGRNGVDATRDALTGVYARQYLLRRLDKDYIQAKKQNEDLALLMVAIDGFAKIAETHGQDAGGMVLCKIANVVRSMQRPEDVFARYDNDTFVILLHNLSEAAVVVLAQRIRRTVKYHHFIWAGEKILVTVSLGVGNLTRDMKNAMDLIREVQAHLDKARSAGPDTINGHQSIRAIFQQMANRHVA